MGIINDLERLTLILNCKPLDLSEVKEELACIFNTPEIQLREVQLEALAIIVKYRRGFFSIGVGHGKTIISILAPVVSRSHRALLFVPSALVEQLTQVDIPELEKLFDIKLDWICIQGMSQHKRRSVMNKHRITIFPYSYLSVEDTEELLEASNADLFVCDEVHYLKNQRSALTKRFMSYLKKHNSCAFVGMSGTIIKKSIMDYHHLVIKSIRQFAPLPFEYTDSVNIQDVIDYKTYRSYGESLFLATINPKLKVNFGEYIVDVEKSRLFMRELFKKSPATVLTENQSVECSLLINPIEIKTDKKVLKILEGVLEDWKSLDGDEFEDYLTLQNYLHQISSGFYYRLYWEENTPNWMLHSWNLKQEFTKELRSWMLKRHRTKLDTPKLVIRALKEKDKKVKHVQPFYDDWKSSLKGEIDERQRSTNWISNYKIDFAKKWAKENKKGIIWYKWDAVGIQLSEALPNAVYCPADTDIKLLKSEGVLICSFAHAEGKNLQHQNRNLLFNIPSNGALMEQLVGRTHRQGQLEDCVFVDILIGNDSDKEVLKNTIKQSKFLHSTVQEQKIIIADWSNHVYKNVS